MKRAIIIMVKTPLAGTVKTRLQNVLGAERCAEFAECLLADAVRKAQTFENQLIIAYSPPENGAYFQRFSDKNIILIPQKGDDIGARMFHAFEFAFRQNSDAVVMTGTDSPTFPIDYIEQAFEHLELETDAVLGKAEDGGFYLIGLRRLDARIFERVAWSSPQTFAQVYGNLRRLEWHLREVPSWYDVDTPADLEKLKTELRHNQNAQRRAPKTFEWIAKNLT
jgi:uncharacterized protein